MAFIWKLNQFWSSNSHTFGTVIERSTDANKTEEEIENKQTLFIMFHLTNAIDTYVRFWVQNNS